MRRTTMQIVVDKIDSHPQMTRRVEGLTVYGWNKATGVGWAMLFDEGGRFRRGVRMDTDPEEITRRFQEVVDGLGLRV